MSLFQTNDSPASRRLLFVVALLLILVGLLWEWILPGDEAATTVEESLERVAQIEESRPALTSAALPEDPPPTPEASEFQRLRDSLDLSDAPAPLPEKVEGEDFELYVNVTSAYLTYLFDKIGYTGDQVEAGAFTAVPPLIVVSIPSGWADDMTVQLKKSLFYRVILPLVLIENDAVLAERETLLVYRDHLRNRSPVSREDREAALELARKYRVLDAEAEQALDLAAVEELLLRVDLVPPSLALGQAAYESGYATSRFAHVGNALFGQWDWSKDRIRPEGQRDGMGDYGIKAFAYPIDSVRAYLWNLNTHHRYADFRTRRAALRGAEEAGLVALDGHALAATLTAYSERGEEYTDELQGIISFNRLTLADGLRLLEGDPIYFD